MRRLVGEKPRQLRDGAEPPRVDRMIERPTDWAVSEGAVKPIVDLH